MYLIFPHTLGGKNRGVSYNYVFKHIKKIWYINSFALFLRQINVYDVIRYFTNSDNSVFRSAFLQTHTCYYQLS